MNKEALRINNLNIYYSSCHGSRIRNIISGGSKKAQPIHAIKDLSFTMYQGEVVGVIGLNGSGKTTLLRTVAGVFSPDSGEVNLYGNRASMMALGVGFDPELTGRENIVLSGMMQGFSKRETTERLDDIIGFSELGDFIDYPVRTYSSGMHSRLAFSITSFLKTDIMLVDEVMSVGDAHFRNKSEEKMMELIGDKKHSVLIVSHDEGIIRNVCGRVIWLDGGSLRMDGKTDDVLSEYNDFLGRLKSEG